MKQNVFFSNEMFMDYENLLFSLKNQCDSAFSLIVDSFQGKENKSLEMLFMLQIEIDNNVVIFDSLSYKTISKNNDQEVAMYLWFYFDVLNYFVSIFRKIIDLSKYVNILDSLRNSESFVKIIEYIKQNKSIFDKILSSIFDSGIISDIDKDLFALINTREKLFSEIIDLYSDDEGFTSIINLVKNLSLILESHIIISYKCSKFIDKVGGDQ